MTGNHHIPQPVPVPLCTSFAALLPVLNEPAVDAHAAAEARAHAATCAYCQSQLVTYDRLEAALLRHLGPAETPRRPTEDIMRDLMNDQPQKATDLTIPTPLPGPRRPGRSRRFISGLAAMAAILVTVVIIAALFFSRASNEHPGTAASSSPTPAVTVSPTAGLVRGSDTEINAISMVSPTEGWAVGMRGYTDHEAAVLLHYHNGVWSEDEYPTNSFNENLTGVSMVSATDGWAVGDGSLVLHYDGKSWQPVSTPIQGCSASVQMLSATDGWITGCSSVSNPPGQAKIFHYDGHAWTIQPLPAGLNPNHFFGVSMVSPTEGWAVGNTDSAISGMMQGSSGAGVNSFILHYKDGRWTVQSAYQSTNFYSISMASASDGWAAGLKTDTSNGTPFLVHYTQGHWVQVANPLPGTHADGFYAVHMASATDGWLATDQDQRTGWPTLLHWNGTAWTVTNLPTISDTTNVLINSIATPSAGDAWAVGFRSSGPEEGLPANGGYQPTTLPVVFHYSNGAWQVVKSQ